MFTDQQVYASLRHAEVPRCASKSGKTSEQPYAALGRRLRKLRLSRGASRGEMASLLEVPLRRWIDFELGKRRIPINVAQHLAGITCVSLGWIMCGCRDDMRYVVLENLGASC